MKQTVSPGMFWWPKLLVTVVKEWGYNKPHDKLALVFGAVALVFAVWSGVYTGRWFLALLGALLHYIVGWAHHRT